MSVIRKVQCQVDKWAKMWELCCIITFVTQSDLFSVGTENNHDNINKYGSLHCEFSTHEFPV